MQVLIPIATRSPFFPLADYSFPLPLIEVAGRPMIELLVEEVRKNISDARFIFVVDADESRAFSLGSILKLCAGPDCSIIERFGQTSGALCSCLLAIEEIDGDAPLLVMNCDQLIDANLSTLIRWFEAQNSDAAVLTFESLHPRWSYILKGLYGEVIQASEKKVISRDAIAGVYYFRMAKDFFSSAKKVILNDVNTDGKFYISSAINQVILDGGYVVSQGLDRCQYHSFYSPAKIEEFERTSLAQRIRSNAKNIGSVNVVIPAAGEGSRFAKAGWKKPKPFIDVGGSPMLTHVMNNVAPHGANSTVLLRSAHIGQYPEILEMVNRQGVSVTEVKKLTQGTACTVLLARNTFDNAIPLIIANSDQLVDFDVNDFLSDCRERNLDGSILVFRDAKRDPKWSFARVDEHGLVKEVAEKQPISDLATVGIYLFMRGSDFVHATVDMMIANDRVNGEFYTCPVYNYLIASGSRIGVYEVPKDAMAGLGTPEDLDAFIKAKGFENSADSPD